jgi:hypothetical protein
LIIDSDPWFGGRCRAQASQGAGNGAEAAFAETRAAALTIGELGTGIDIDV